MRVFTEETIARACRQLNIASPGKATIMDNSKLSAYLETQTGIPVIHMELGSPGFAPNRIGIEAEKAALDAVRIRAEQLAAAYETDGEDARALLAEWGTAAADALEEGLDADLALAKDKLAADEASLAVCTEKRKAADEAHLHDFLAEGHPRKQILDARLHGHLNGFQASGTAGNRRGADIRPQADAMVAGAEELAVDPDPLEVDRVAQDLHLRQLQARLKRIRLAGILQCLADIQRQPNTP